jgi:pyruvate/2-oxoglutarate dehydrogenase complex dihydrolipoamide acyltransferase (E2) component
MSESVHPVVVPRVNVNDNEVRLVEWVAKADTKVLQGEVICIVDTSKAAVEVETEHAGVIVPVVMVGAMIPVGEPVAYVGPSLEAVEEAITTLDQTKTLESDTSISGTLRSTARAEALAHEHGIDLAKVAATGVKGTIKERDVRRFLENMGNTDPLPELRERAPEGLPDALLPALEPGVDLSRHELAVIEGLQQSQDQLILATLDYQIGAGSFSEAIQRYQQSGIMLSIQHIAIAALGRILPKFSRLMTIRDHGLMYTYSRTDVAFVVRSHKGQLFTPVVRDVGALDLKEVARACASEVMSVNRGEVSPEDLEGACFTVSHISDTGVARFMALPNRFQSAILAIAGERPGLSESTINMTLSYDHGLCDGTYVADFLKELSGAMEALLE